MCVGLVWSVADWRCGALRRWRRCVRGALRRWRRCVRAGVVAVELICYKSVSQIPSSTSRTCIRMHEFVGFPQNQQRVIPRPPRQRRLARVARRPPSATPAYPAASRDGPRRRRHRPCYLGQVRRPWRSSTPWLGFGFGFSFGFGFAFGCGFRFGLGFGFGFGFGLGFGFVRIWVGIRLTVGLGLGLGSGSGSGLGLPLPVGSDATEGGSHRPRRLLPAIYLPLVPAIPAPCGIAPRPRRPAQLVRVIK